MNVNKVGPSPDTKHLTFGAKINLKSPGIAEYCEYLERCKDAPKGWFSSNRNIDLFSKIYKAFENHPSEEIINAKVLYIDSGFPARGVLETSRGKIMDIEPSRDDDGIGPMQYIFRKLLNPDNKKVFNGLLGEEYSSVYNDWWKENIKPIWKEINKLYEFWPTNGSDPSSKEFDRLFRKQFSKDISSSKKNKPFVVSQQEFSQSKTDKVSQTTKLPFIERLKQAWKILKGN